MSIDNLRIIFDGMTTAVYTPGHTIVGRVLFNTSSFVEIRSVQLKIRGEAKTSWTDYVADQPQISLSLMGTHHHAVKYFANEVLFERINILVGCKDKLFLNAGEHVYPFDIPLPDLLPSTFHGDYGYVQYTAKVTVDKPLGIDQTNEIYFQVFSPYNLNNEPPLLEPKREEKLKSFNNLFFTSGHIKISARVPYTGFVPGQIMPLTIELVNDSNVTINIVLVKLEKNIKFHANEPQSNTKARSIVCVLSSFPVTEGHSSRKWIKEITIPNDLVVNNLKHCRIMDEIFILKVEAKGTSAHTSTEVNMEITMGHIPLIIPEGTV